MLQLPQDTHTDATGCLQRARQQGSLVSECLRQGSPHVHSNPSPWRHEPPLPSRSRKGPLEVHGGASHGGHHGQGPSEGPFTTVACVPAREPRWDWVLLSSADRGEQCHRRRRPRGRLSERPGLLSNGVALGGGRPRGLGKLVQHMPVQAPGRPIGTQGATVQCQRRHRPHR